MRWLLVALAASALYACKTEDITCYPAPDGAPVEFDKGCRPGPPEDTGVDTDGSGDAGDTGGDTTVEPQWAGLACETNQDCGPSPRQCVTRETLDGFGVGPEIDVPGGMCSRLFCSTDADCGTNGTCFDASFLGAPVQICLAQCNDIADCRWEEGWDCLPWSMVLEGSGDEVPEGGACVSDSIQVAVVCDDGHCDAEGSE